LKTINTQIKQFSFFGGKTIDKICKFVSVRVFRCYIGSVAQSVEQRPFKPSLAVFATKRQ